MSEQLNVETTCHFCDTPLEGIMLTRDAIVHLVVKASNAVRDEMKQTPTIGHVCAHCGTGFCIEHFRQLGPHGLRGFLQGLGKTPCPQCDQPLKDYLTITATPSAEYRAFIDQEIDEVLNPKSFGEFLKDSVGEIRDTITEPAEEVLWLRGTFLKSDGSEIEPPGRAPLLDFWPGRCTSCGEETDQPITYVVYSCCYESRKVRGGLVREYEEHLYDRREHPVRRCIACAKKGKRLGGFAYDPHAKAKERIEKARAAHDRVSIRVADTLRDL